MTGDHELLAEKATAPLPRNVFESRFKDFLHFLLTSQYVRLSHDPVDTCFGVTKGRGMGLIMSGDVSDLAFYELAEHDFATVPDTVSNLVVVAYFRYKDDVLIILRGEQSERRSFIHKWIDRALPFVLQIESTSTKEVVMLDVRIFKGPIWSRSGHLDTSIYTKPTSLSLPLSSSSSHPTHIHNNWPLARIQTFGSLCAGEEDFNSARNLWLSKIKKSSPRHPCVAAVLSTSFISSKRTLRPIARVGNPVEFKPAWMVLPFHHRLEHAGLPNTLHNIWQRWKHVLAYSGLNMSCIMPRVSWRLVEPRMIQRLIHINRFYGR